MALWKLFFLVFQFLEQSSYLIVYFTRSLVLFVCFVGRCLYFCTFSFGGCVYVLWFWLLRHKTLSIYKQNLSCPNELWFFNLTSHFGCDLLKVRQVMKYVLYFCIHSFYVQVTSIIALHIHVYKWGLVDRVVKVVYLILTTSHTWHNLAARFQPQVLMFTDA
jgi:hypothetical protein